MDSIALVEEKISAGRNLVERLTASGIPVTAAAWVKPTERFKWYLYLVTPLVGENGGVRPAYRRINPVIRQLQDEGVAMDFFETMVVGRTSSTGEAIAVVSQQNSSRRVTRYDGAYLGDLSIDAAYVYPPVPAPAAS